MNRFAKYFKNITETDEILVSFKEVLKEKGKSEEDYKAMVSKAKNLCENSPLGYLEVLHRLYNEEFRAL
jgi:hypothetical protein